MTKKTMNVTKTIGAIMAVGGAAAMVGSAMMSSNNATKKQVKRTANKAFKTINGVLDGIQSMI
ncbi:MAG: hypothetical protein IKW03_00895 [Clostridia bacterium]|nr:hypothetical protein [Clostridia bacterium]